MPRSCSKNRCCPTSGHAPSRLRTSDGADSLTKRPGAAVDGSTLQRPPPLMRILRPPSAVRSRSVTAAPASRALMAAISPAAPAPITITCGVTTAIPSRAGNQSRRTRHSSYRESGMSLARTALLKISDSQWMREHGVKAPFVRRAVSTFMPGETAADMLNAAAAQAAEGVGAVFTRLGENVLDMDEAQRVTDHYLGVIDDVRARRLACEPSIKLTQLGLDVDPDRAFANALAIGRHADAGRQLLLGGHGAVALRRPHARRGAPAARGDPAHRRGAAGLPASHRRRCRVDGRPWHRHPPGQGRLQRAAGRSPSRRRPTSTPTT